MKKLSMALAIVMLFVSCFCFTVSAENSLKVSVSAPAEVTKGQELTVTVNFSENTGFNTIGLKLTYPEGFTLVEQEGACAAASDFAKGKFVLNMPGYESGETYVFYHDEEARTVSFVGATIDNITETAGELFSVKFKAPDAPAENQTFAIELVDNTYDYDGAVITVDKVNGTVKINDGPTYKLGNVTMDFDADGKDVINYMDAIVVLQISAGLIENPSSLVLELANVTNDYDENGDPIVNYLDAIRILQHAAGLYTIG